MDDLYMNLFDTINHEFNHMFVEPCEDNKCHYKLKGEVGVSFLNEAAATSYNYNILNSLSFLIKPSLTINKLL